MRIALEGVGKRYGKTRVLDGVTLDVPAGARLALVGPNGSGKSTLIKIVVGLLAHEGRVLFDGAEHRPLERIAYAPQVAPQSAAPAGELVRAVTALRGIDPAQVAARAAELELDVAAIAARPFRALSGGMKHKLLLAMALAAAPELLVLDEPTASLDARGRARFLAAAAAVPRETTIILCSHRLEELRGLVDHVVELADGRVAACGAAEEVLGRRAAAVLELHVRGGHQAWLRARGFAPAAGGAWVRAVVAGEKMELLRAAVAALGDDLVDVSARDLDALEVSDAA